MPKFLKDRIPICKKKIAEHVFCNLSKGWLVRNLVLNPTAKIMGFNSLDGRR